MFEKLEKRAWYSLFANVLSVLEQVSVLQLQVRESPLLVSQKPNSGKDGCYVAKWCEKSISFRRLAVVVQERASLLGSKT